MRFTQITLGARSFFPTIYDRAKASWRYSIKSARGSTRIRIDIGWFLLLFFFFSLCTPRTEFIAQSRDRGLWRETELSHTRVRRLLNDGDALCIKTAVCLDREKAMGRVRRLTSSGTYLSKLLHRLVKVFSHLPQKTFVSTLYALCKIKYSEILLAL